MCSLTLAELRPGSDATLFVFAGAGGAPDELAPLASALGGPARVVAVASVAPAADDTIGSMASAAVDLLRTQQPHGPYRLLGYSFGGLLALEAAQALQDAGEAVVFVGLVDALFDQRHWPTSLFLKATVRRTALHLRHLLGMFGHSPARAVREGWSRAGRLAGRVLGRRQSPATGPASFASVQDANLAVMARWVPHSYGGEVTLFTASESDFGCDLAQLWRPWLPGLRVRRVEGSHLTLTQTPAGVARLAADVSQALGWSPSRLRVLVATTFRWLGAARLAADFHQVGCDVEAVAPRGSVLHRISAVRRSHRLGLVDPVGSLARAIRTSEADLVVPFDDRTRHALGLLHADTDASTDAGARLREVLERSLGSPDKFRFAYSRAALLQIARSAGVSCPPTVVVRSESAVVEWLDKNPGRAVLKTDGSWGGRGVAVVQDLPEARRVWREMSRRPALARAVKRLVVERDPWAMRAMLAGRRPTVSIQRFIEGRPANAAIACFRGATLGTVQAVVVESDGATGPSTVIRIVDDADLTFAAKSVVSHLELSGLCGLDFIIDADGHAHLLELNPRATPTSHLVGADGADLLTALRTAVGHECPGPRTAAYGDRLVALFPQAQRNDAGSQNLRAAYLDVPSHAPDLVQLMRASLRDGRGRGRLPRWMTSLGADSREKGSAV